MKINYTAKKGQTLIETAIAIFVLLLILIGIVDFSLAFYTKTSLKNAVRHGARVAVVTPSLTAQNGTCPGTGIIAEVCSQSGVPVGTAVNLTIADTSLPSGLSSGDTVTVSAQTTYNYIMSAIWGRTSDVVRAEASMRYE